ncbi:MAG: radical SAM protein [Bdellovibrionota bacterium]
MKAKKILLIMPDANMHKLRFGSFVRSAREAPITLTTLAALSGNDPEIEYRLVDESIDIVPLDYAADLVGISVMTGTSQRAYALADHFRRRGIPVVLGGIHVTLCHNEAQRFADTLVFGMADESWPRLIADFKLGNLQLEYRETLSQGPYTRTTTPPPRYDLQRKSGYMVPYVVQATRGCMHACDFCSVPAYWNRFTRRPVADVIRDIKSIPAKRFVLNDVSPVDDVEYAKELFKALIPLKKTWGGLATTQIVDEPELFDLMVKSGCEYLLLGFESVNQNALDKIGKRFNSTERYHELMRMLHKSHIVVQGCFVFGFDHDHQDVFAKTVQRVQELKIDIPRYSIYTPYPGTRLFKRLEEENRILSYNWSDYNTMHVVYQPKNMSATELYEGFRWAYRETFKISKIWERTKQSGHKFPITFMGNLTYNLFSKRLYTRPGFEMRVHGRDAFLETKNTSVPLITTRNSEIQNDSHLSNQ